MNQVMNVLACIVAVSCGAKVRVAYRQTASPYNLSWPPTYNMSLSTISNPDGNHSGLDNDVLLARDAKYGIIVFDGNDRMCLNNRKGPPGDPCKYKSTQADAEELARAVKAVNPKTHVFTYHNQEEALLRRQQDCEIMLDPAYEYFFIHNSSGEIINNWLGPQHVEYCQKQFPDFVYDNESQYALDFRKANVSEWWLENVIGFFLNSTLLEGFYWDCPSITTPFGESMNATELAQANAAMQATRDVGHERIAKAGKWALDMFSDIRTPMTCPMPCKLNWELSGTNNCNQLCDYSPSTCATNMRIAAGSQHTPGVNTLPFLPITVRPNLAMCGTGPSLVADDDTVELELELSCVPGTGTMTVEFASYGLPAVATNGRYIKCATPPCPSSDLYYEDLDANIVYTAEQGRCPRPRTVNITNVTYDYFNSLTESLDVAACGVHRNCSKFAANAACDAGPDVLKIIKSLCDGKQSCKFNMSTITATQPSNCTNPNHEPLRLAVKASGCQQGTASAFYRQTLAGFLITRGPQSWQGHGWIAGQHPIWYPEWDVDYGEPIGDMVVEGMLHTRAWSKFNVTLDCSTFEAEFIPTSY
eukprot:m.4174 g.4174  ORF g.4174 m.4174 type:complete len:588 (-) comp2913_c0_seq1:112-1875(-)